METIQVKDFAKDVYKYLDFDNFRPFLLENVDGRRLKIVEEVPVGRWATEEDYEDFRLGREEIARGECYAMRRDETVEEFFARIDADPVGTMQCNTVEWKAQH